MSKIPIIPSQKSEEGCLLLDVPLNLIQIPKWLNELSASKGFKAKEEYHVTVIGIDLAALIKKQGKTDQIKSLIDSFNWTIEVSDQFIELAKDDENGIHRQSIICIVKIPELVTFYDQLTDILGEKIETPPAHVTLYTKNYDRGIGVYSENDLQTFKVRDVKIKP